LRSSESRWSVNHSLRGRIIRSSADSDRPVIRFSGLSMGSRLKLDMTLERVMREQAQVNRS
jgi:hypothetical protein